MGWLRSVPTGGGFAEKSVRFCVACVIVRAHAQSGGPCGKLGWSVRLRQIRPCVCAMAGEVLQVPVHAVRDGFREGGQAAAIASPRPSGQGHLN